MPDETPAAPLPRVLLTGATGFLGAFLLEEFHAAGHAIRVLARRADHPALAPWTGRVEVAQGDVTAPETLAGVFEGIDWVVHAAGVVAFDRRARRQLLAVNQHGTAHVVNYALEAGVQKLVYVSSIAAIGRPAQLTEPLTEDLPWTESPYNSYYGYSKMLGEREVQRGVAEGLPSAILNPTIIVGPGGWQRGPGVFFRRVYRGLRYYPTGLNGFTGGWDVARATRLLLASDYQAGERFIACAECLRFQAFLVQVAAALGVRPPQKALPMRTAVALGSFFETVARLTGTPPLLTAETARASAHETLIDGSRLRQAFDFSYEPIYEVVRKTADAYRAHLGRIGNR